MGLDCFYQVGHLEPGAVAGAQLVTSLTGAVAAEGKRCPLWGLPGWKKGLFGDCSGGGEHLYPAPLTEQSPFTTTSLPFW